MGWVGWVGCRHLLQEHRSEMPITAGAGGNSGWDWIGWLLAGSLGRVNRFHDNVHDDMNMSLIMHDHSLFIAMINIPSPMINSHSHSMNNIFMQNAARQLTFI